MARLDQAVESRTLVRSCFENLFLVDQLLKHGAAFVKTMRSHEAANRISMGESTLKRPGVALARIAAMQRFSQIGLGIVEPQLDGFERGVR